MVTMNYSSAPERMADGSLCMAGSVTDDVCAVERVDDNRVCAVEGMVDDLSVVERAMTSASRLGGQWQTMYALWRW